MKTSGNIQFSDSWAGEDPHEFDIDYKDSLVTISIAKLVSQARGSKQVQTITFPRKSVRELIIAMQRIEPDGR